MPKLSVITGENKGASYTFEDEVIMGRSPDDSGFVLKDLRASRKHAKVFRVKTDYYLEDMSSQNGTFLNGRRIKERIKLKNNDNIRIGTTWIAFITEEESIIAGESFLGYKIIKEVAQEATGNIYLAEQTALERKVLIWVLPVDSLSSQAEQAQQNFFKQISMVAKLFHPNIMMLMDFDVTNRYFYCAFEEVDFSNNIKNYLKNNKQLAIETALDIAIQVAAGMHYAHNKDVYHLHLTSKNVLVQPETFNRVVLTEFGVSRFLSEMTASDAGTTTGILGISDYIAPEQISGKYPENEATDIYSYGCLLYHLFSGAPPFQSKSLSQLAKAHLSDDPKPLNELRKEAPPELKEIASKCLQKEPEDRYQSFGEIVKQMRALQEKLEFSEMLASEEGKGIIKNYMGERILYRWWILLPIIALLLAALIFFAVPVVLG